MFYFLLILGFKSYSAVYIPLPEDSLVKWVMRYEYVDPGVCHEVYYFDYRMIGDTSIGGNSYKKIYSENLYLTYSQFGTPGCSNPPVNRYISAFRQDTLNKKAYLLLPGLSSDTLLYDFSLNVGDTLFSIVNDFTLGCANFNVINALDSVLVDGVYCQWQKFSNCVDGYVEGVGSLNDPFQAHSITEGSYNLVCLKRDTSVIFDQTSYGVFCNIYSSVNENVSPTLLIYPSPAFDFFELDFTENVKLDLIKIFDSFGKQVYCNQDLENKRISTEFFRGGIYMIEAVIDNGIKYSRKLIVIK